MTANSQFIPVKAIQALMRRGSPPTFSPRRYQRPWVNALDGIVFKRSFDIVFSLLVLIIFSPLYLILAVLIKIDSPGPIFYIATRLRTSSISMFLPLPLAITAPRSITT